MEPYSIINAYSLINPQESQNTILTYRFEEENYKNRYVLEDYYDTNPFNDNQSAVLSFRHEDDPESRISFVFNFNRTCGVVPNQKKLTEVQTQITDRFVKEMPEELFVLFKQRYLEAKAYGEKEPFSYLVFDPKRFVNYMEIAPKGNQLLDFSFEDEKYFVEDAYNLDPERANRNVRLTFYKLDPNEEKLPPIFHYTYYFKEEKREAEDAKLTSDQRDMLTEFNRFIPNLYDVLKKRYKEAKKTGEMLQESQSGLGVG